MVVQDGKVYVSLNGDVRYHTNPFGSITATVTNVSASAGTVTYTTSAAHGFTAGQIVNITGVNPTAYNLSEATIATASGSTFTITNGATGTFVSGGIAVQHTWVNCTGEPGGTCQAMATDGNDVYLAFPSDGVRKIDTSVAAGTIDSTKFVNSNDNYYMLGFAKNYMWGSHSHVLNTISSGGSKTAHVTPDDTAFRWVGVATGQNAVYAAGYSGKKSLIYKITITTVGSTTGTLDAGVVALELPTGEVVTAISGYLGSIIIGTNKGVRYCSTDAQSNLVAGQLIPTSGPVYKLASDDRFIWFTWSNYDGTSGGLGRLDLSVFTASNTPAFATDLMYTSNNDVTNIVIFQDASTGAYKRVFTISGVGVIAEDSANLVASGEIETGTWRWGIPDRKFVAKIDTRATPLVGSITPYLKLDDGDYQQLAAWNTGNDTEYSVNGSDAKAIEAAFKFTLTRSSTATGTGPTFTRWMARAYVAPFRSQVFMIPILLHESVRIRDKEYFYDVEDEQLFFDGLISSPRIVTLQIGTINHTVIVEDIAWEPADSHGNTWKFDGTLAVTLRSVEN